MCTDAFRNDGRCYRECDGRSVIGNVSTGALGTHSSMHAHARDTYVLGAYRIAEQQLQGLYVYCVWILTVHADVDDYEQRVWSASTNTAIVLNVENDYRTACYKVRCVLIVLMPVASCSDLEPRS